MKCLKCQWSPLHPMRPRRHHAKCPLRGIGTARRRTRALFDRVDLSGPRFGVRPLTPLPPIRRLILAPTWSFSGPPVLVLSSEWALHRAPPWATGPVLAVQRPRLDPPVPLTPDSTRAAEPVCATIDQFQLHLFKRGEGETFRVYLPLGQDPTDEIASTIEPLVALLDLARVPGMTERAMGEFAFQRFGWFRASVEWRVRKIRPWSLREEFFSDRERRERDRAYRRAVECECAELIGGARALLAEGAGQ